MKDFIVVEFIILLAGNKGCQVDCKIDVSIDDVIEGINIIMQGFWIKIR